MYYSKFVKWYKHHEPRQQIFPFPKEMMDHIFANIKPKTLRSLRQTCRLLTKKLPKMPIIDNLELSHRYRYEIINKHSLQASAYGFRNSFYLKKIYLLNKFLYNQLSPHIPKVLKRIEKCLIKELHLSQNGIELKDFEFLTNEGTVEVLNLFQCDVQNSLPVDEILKRVPNAYQISISPSYITSKTSLNLSKLQHRQKIKTFELFAINGIINVGYLWEFFVANLAPKAKIRLVYNYHVESTEFFELLKQMIDCWEPYKDKPMLKI